MIRAVADTHAIVWYIFNDPRLSSGARSLINSTSLAGDAIAFSAISYVELVYLIEKGRVPADPINRLLRSHGQGWTPARLAVRDHDGEIQAAASVLFRRPARGVPVSVAYVPRGPVMAYDETQPATVALLAGLHRLCRRRGAILLKVEPNGETN